MIQMNCKNCPYWLLSREERHVVGMAECLFLSEYTKATYFCTEHPEYKKWEISKNPENLYEDSLEDANINEAEWPFFMDRLEDELFFLEDLLYQASECGKYDQAQIHKIVEGFEME